MIHRVLPIFLAAVVVPVSAQIVSYEGTSLPETEGWTRSDRQNLADRWLGDGWFVQYAEVLGPGPPEVGEEDYYRRSLAEFAGLLSLFLEWNMETDGPREGIPAVAPAAFVAGGQMGIRYHYTIARDQVRFIDSDLNVLYVDLQADMPHTHRLELRADGTYLWYIDGTIVDAGVAPQPYPTADSVVVFGAAAAGGPVTVRWDYIRVGVIPAEGSGDYDSDGALTVVDQYFVADCLTKDGPGIFGGPGNDAGPGCRFADFDADADVDLLDFAEFQNHFTAANP